MAATFGTMGGGQFEGRAAARPQVMRELVRLDPSTSFWYMHHPARWTYKDGEWLPWLSKLSADPGVANVDQGGDTAAAEVAKRRKGWTIIPWDAEPGGYVVAYDGVAGTVHLSKWEVPKMVAGQTRIQGDEEGYWAFCRRLVTDGYIERPDPPLRRDHVVDVQTRLGCSWRRIEHRGFLAGVGLVDDPWIVAAERGWLRAVAPSFGEEAGWMNRSDLGLWVGYRRGPLVVRADLSSGEGSFLRERNEEKNLSGSLWLRPIPALAFAVYGRQGFTGLQAVSSHRVGGQVHAFLGEENGVQLGLEVLKAWGVDGEERREPLGGSLWAVGAPWGPLQVFARGDLASEELGEEKATSGSLRVGGGVAFGPARLLGGWEYRWAGEDVAVAAGAGDSTDMNVFYVQLDVDLRWEKP